MKLNKFYKSLLVLISSTSLIACNNGYSEGNAVGGAGISSKVQNGSLVKDPGLNSIVPLILITSSDGTSICSGTLLDEYTVLTASHCVLNMKKKKPAIAYKNSDVIDAGSIQVFLSKNPHKPINLQNINSRSQLLEIADFYNVKHVYAHNYAFRSAEVGDNGFNLNDGGDLNDLAILKLGRATPDSYEFPKLATKNPLPNSKQIIVGYGVNIGDGVKIKDKANGDSGVLRQSETLFIDSSFSGKLLDVGGYVKRGKKSVYAKICQGDSGGPDFQKVKGEYIITGVHSFGDGEDCGKPDTPSTSISVAKYRAWINGDYKTQSIGN